MVSLDTMNYNLFEMVSMPYDIFMRIYARKNTTQVSKVHSVSYDWWWWNFIVVTLRIYTYFLFLIGSHLLLVSSMNIVKWKILFRNLKRNNTLFSTFNVFRIKIKFKSYWILISICLKVFYKLSHVFIKDRIRIKKFKRFYYDFRTK